MPAGPSRRGQGAPRDDRFRASRKDGDAVPAALALPDGAVPGIAEGARRKGSLRGLELLQADHVRARLRQPREQVRQSAIDVVDVEGGNLQ
jgi:hypothetical protein